MKINTGTERKFVVLLALYSLLHLCLRVWISGSLEKDESEMILYLQEQFKLGYNSQPPLYTWLQLSLFALFGAHIFSLALLKNTLIFLIYFFLFRSAKLLCNDDIRAIFSSVSLFLVYNFSWIMHKDLTHTVLLMALVSATFYAFFSVVLKPSRAAYIGLGIVVGLGLLSKYNYALFVICLLAAGIIARPYRARILSRWFLLTLAVAALLVAPHVAWMLTHNTLLMRDMGDFGIQEHALATVFFRLCVDALLLILPLIVIYALIWPAGFKRSKAALSPQAHARNFLTIFFACSFAVITVLMAANGVGHIKVRWLQPFLCIVPLYFFLGFPGDLSFGRREKIFAGLVAFCLVGTVFSIYGRVLFASSREKYSRLNKPYGAIAAKLLRAGFSGGVILTDDIAIGGNLKRYFPGAYVIVPDIPLVFDPPRDFETILVITEQVRKDFPPASLAKALAQLGIAGYNSEPFPIEHIYKYSKKDRYRVRAAIIER